MDEEELFFKRFPAEKQDQVRQLVGFATLMGLTGKDLIAIGGKLDRAKASQDLKRRREAIASYTLLPIGHDATLNKYDQKHKMLKRFKIETTSGSYYFETHYHDGFTIRNPTTKVKVRHTPQYRDWGNTSWNVRERNDMLMDIHDGLIKLNF